MWPLGLLLGCSWTLVPCQWSLCGGVQYYASGGQFMITAQFILSTLACTIVILYGSINKYNIFTYTQYMIVGSTTTFQWLLCVWWPSCSPLGGAVDRRNQRPSQPLQNQTRVLEMVKLLSPIGKQHETLRTNNINHTRYYLLT